MRQHTGIAAGKGIHPIGLHLVHIARGMHMAGRHCKHAAGTRIQQHRNRVRQILRTIRQARRGRAHGAGQHHRFARLLRTQHPRRRGHIQHALQEPGSLFQRIGAVRDHQSLHIVLRQPVRAAQGQSLPQRVVHVLAVDLGHLLCGQRTVTQQLLQTRHLFKQCPNRHFARPIRNAIRRTGRCSGNGAPCRQNHDFFHTCRALACKTGKTG